jgi:hypothetical protein
LRFRGAAQIKSLLLFNINRRLSAHPLQFRGQSRRGHLARHGVQLLCQQFPDLSGQCSLGAVANVGIANYVFTNQYSWWLAGISGVAVGAVWNYAATSVFTWRIAK